MVKSVHISWIISVIIFMGCQSPKSEKQGSVIDAEAIQRLDSALRSFVKNGEVVGASALIFEKGEEVYFNAFGHADRENEVPMKRNTIITIYSMTKPVTGTALMKLYEQGKFQLDDPLEKYAPEFKDMQVFVRYDSVKNEPILEPANRPITIRDITRHTAGFVNNASIPYLGPLMTEADPMNRSNTLPEMAEKLGTLPLMFHPGEEWAYGSSVDVQAFLVERISGVPYGEFVRTSILDPLGMSETRYFLPDQDHSRLAAMYHRTESDSLARVPKEAHLINLEKWPLTPGGYGLTSTLDDYMTFAQMLVNEGAHNDVTILRPETIRLMATNHLADSVTERMWLPTKGQVGFGIDFAVRLKPPVDEKENNGAVGEFFWDGAASTLFWVDPVNDLTAVLFVQIFPFNGKVHKQFRDAVYGTYKRTEQ